MFLSGNKIRKLTYLSPHTCLGPCQPYRRPLPLLNLGATCFACNATPLPGRVAAGACHRAKDTGQAAAQLKRHESSVAPRVSWPGLPAARCGSTYHAGLLISCGISTFYENLSISCLTSFFHPFISFFSSHSRSGFEEDFCPWPVTLLKKKTCCLYNV